MELRKRRPKTGGELGLASKPSDSRPRRCYPQGALVGAPLHLSTSSRVLTRLYFVRVLSSTTGELPDWGAVAQHHCRPEYLSLLARFFEVTFQTLKKIFLRVTELR